MIQPSSRNHNGWSWEYNRDFGVIKCQKSSIARVIYSIFMLVSRPVVCALKTGSGYKFDFEYCLLPESTVLNLDLVLVRLYTWLHSSAMLYCST